MAEHARYLDEPYALELVAIDRCMDELRILSNHCHTPLPQRWRSRCAAMVLRLTALRREMTRNPQDLLDTHAAEEERG